MEKFKLMVIDDNKEFCSIVKDYVEMQDDIIFAGAAFDGLTALDLIKARNPDVILLDIIMPNLDGLGVLKKLQEFPKREMPKIVVATNFPSDVVVSNAYKLGVSYTMSMKLDIDEMIDRCRMVMHGPFTLSDQKIELENTEEAVTDMLHEIGVPANVKGHKYLTEAIIMVMDDSRMLDAITKSLYPALAKRNGSTPSRVERNIRSAVEIAWTRGNPEVLNKTFGYTIDKEKGKPTNSEFIAMVSDKLRINLKKSYKRA